MKKENLNLKVVSLEEMKKHESGNYNREVWLEKIDRILSYDKDAVFYIQEKDPVFSYDRFFVTYKIESEGLLMFTDFGFSSSINSIGFIRIHITKNGEVYTFKFESEEGEFFRVKNSKEGRKWLSENVCSKGFYITNKL